MLLLCVRCVAWQHTKTSLSKFEADLIMAKRGTEVAFNAAIIMSWFVSPILTGACAALIFFVVRTLVLRRKNAYNLSFWTLPPFVCITVWINVYFILTKVSLCISSSCFHIAM